MELVLPKIPDLESKAQFKSRTSWDDNQFKKFKIELQKKEETIKEKIKKP